MFQAETVEELDEVRQPGPSGLAALGFRHSGAIAEVARPAHGSGSLLLQQCREVLLESRSKLLPIRACAQRSRISRSTLEKWLDRGRRESEALFEDLEAGRAIDIEETAYARFWLDWEQAVGNATYEAQRKILAAADKDPRNWAALMTSLERSDPENFGRRESVKVQQDKNVTITIVETDQWHLVQNGRLPEAIEARITKP